MCFVCKTLSKVDVWDVIQSREREREREREGASYFVRRKVRLLFRERGRESLKVKVRE